jgi:hypothetical protein
MIPSFVLCRALCGKSCDQGASFAAKQWFVELLPGMILSDLSVGT